MLVKLSGWKLALPQERKLGRLDSANDPQLGGIEHNPHCLMGGMGFCGGQKKTEGVNCRMSLGAPPPGPKCKVTYKRCVCSSSC